MCPARVSGRYLMFCSRRSQSACRCLAPRKEDGCGRNEPESVWGGRREPRLSGCGSPERSEDEEEEEISTSVTSNSDTEISDTTATATETGTTAVPTLPPLLLLLLIHSLLLLE